MVSVMFFAHHISYSVFLRFILLPLVFGSLFRSPIIIKIFVTMPLSFLPFMLLKFLFLSFTRSFHSFLGLRSIARPFSFTSFSFVIHSSCSFHGCSSPFSASVAPRSQAGGNYRKTLHIRLNSVSSQHSYLRPVQCPPSNLSSIRFLLLSFFAEFFSLPPCYSQPISISSHSLEHRISTRTYRLSCVVKRKLIFIELLDAGSRWV